MNIEEKSSLKMDKKKSPERLKRPPILSPLKRFPQGSSLRLVSPFDSDQELNDLEVASVLADGKFYAFLKMK